MKTFNKAIQTLSQLSRSISDETRETKGAVEMNSLLQICFDKFKQIEEILPTIFKRNQNLIDLLDQFDNGLENYRQWFHDAKQRIQSYSVDVSLQRLNENLYEQRVRSMSFENLFFFTFDVLRNFPSRSTFNKIFSMENEH